MPPLALLLAAAQAPAPDFALEVRPLLSDRCFLCHGPDEAANASGLRLDTREGALADLGGYAAVVPGDPEGSELLRRVRHPRKPMPPPESGLALDAGEARLLERWIAAGAPWAEHWSFARPERSAPPAVRDADWPRDPLDRFVLARVEAAGLAPAPEADRASWLRRVTYDLTGLPPSPDELDAFLGDTSDDAYERVVDRLLASPRHAERMASHWLDVARYADTWGYQNDRPRTVWPWRDWVVSAFERNLPYDAFVVEQLAGDLLPDATRDQRLATAFQRLHRMTNEGGSVEEEYRVESVLDRVDTFGTAFLGLTLQCARCHDHKYDPVSQREYFALSAFFDGIDEAGLYAHYGDAVPTPALDLPTPDQAERLAALQRAEAEAAEAVAAGDAARRDAFEAWRAADGAWDVGAGLRQRLAFEDDADVRVHATAAPPVNRNDEHDLAAVEDPDATGERGRVVSLGGDDAIGLSAPCSFHQSDAFSVALWVRLPRAYERAVVFHNTAGWTDAASRGYELLVEDGRASGAVVHFWPGDAVRVRTRAELPVGRWTHVAMTWDGSRTADGLALFVDGERADVDVVRDRLTRGIVTGSEGALAVGARQRDRGLAGAHVDDVGLWARELLPFEVARLAGRDGDDPPDDELFAWWLANVDADGRERRTALASARRAVDELRDEVLQVPVMREGGDPRTAHVLERGLYDRRGEPVEPGVPAVLPSLPPDAPRDRLALARWLVHPDHPLTARVAVDRSWRLLLGRGLVETPEDLGAQGAPPSHPRLLDTLARDLVDSGWDLRALLRRIALSATYRQSSRAGARTRERDPDGALFARAVRRPLTAEMLRDGALLAAGLLVERRGGPPVRPYQPAGLWKEKGNATYVPSEGEDLWRRSLYTFWKRTSPPPTMMIFDASKRDVCVPARPRTTTPLQSLVLWNDPQFVEAARALGERMVREAGPDAAARVELAFRWLTSRAPTDDERGALVELHDSERTRFAAEPARAAALAGAGTAPLAEDLEPVDVAACALVASTVLAFDDALTLR